MLGTDYQKRLRAARKEREQKDREWQRYLETTPRADLVDDLCDRLERMFGSSGDGPVYAVAVEADKVRALFHHLLDEARKPE